MSDVVRLENITKVYQMGEETVHALRGVSLTVSRGEFVAIMGSSGSGKSTCMHILGCLDRPSSGSYALDGEAVHDLKKDQLADIRNRKLGFVFQGFNLLSRTSALENVELPLVYGRVPAAERQKRALEALAMVGLAERAGHLSNQLSGGQQQRVAIARALAGKPALILADEPTGNLDSHMSEEIMDIFTRLNSQGITIIMVTHEPDIAAVAGRRITFKDGSIVDDTGPASQAGQAGA
ncbi:MAG: ABC transporter ATP-binding protein [Humidesulfovibrio sp.]|nr:ABC transporter ATP-binding protein [Humidesulfovibrio sp.]